MPIEGLPFIRLEIGQMKKVLMHSLVEYAAKLDSDLREAVAEFCTEPRLKSIIASEADRVMEQVIREEVYNWFTKGDGRDAIRQEVQRRLSEGRTHTPLDNKE